MPALCNNEEMKPTPKWRSLGERVAELKNGESIVSEGPRQSGTANETRVPKRMDTRCYRARRIWDLGCRRFPQPH